MSVKWIFCVALFFALLPLQARAGQGVGEMAATLWDPRTMPDIKAKFWCAENFEVPVCEELEKEWKKEAELAAITELALAKKQNRRPHKGDFFE